MRESCVSRSFDAGDQGFSRCIFATAGLQPESAGLQGGVAPSAEMKYEAMKIAFLPVEEHALH